LRWFARFGAAAINCVFIAAKATILLRFTQESFIFAETNFKGAELWQSTSIHTHRLRIQETLRHGTQQRPVDKFPERDV